MRLELNAARDALEKVADRLGADGDDRAVRVEESALRVPTAVMATELQKNMAQRGEDTKTFDLLAFGGAGTTNTKLLARAGRLNSERTGFSTWKSGSSTVDYVGQRCN